MKTHTICPHCNFNNNNGFTSGIKFRCKYPFIKECYVCDNCNSRFNLYYCHEFWILPRTNLRQFQTYYYFKRI